MKVLGLISGGKDSIWNLHYCAHFGHELVCVANLAPPEGVGEMDSYMYQTVGSEMIHAIAAALDVPLIRRTIHGKPKSIETQTYRPEDGDEVEDLLLLLQDALKAHPSVEAVSCGAILSNYQRLRVENVCQRLGLKVMAFMWMQEQPILLKQMISGHLDARIIKVASMGLETKHVGKSILDPAFETYIFKLGSQFGVHVCGEGGEYESLVVDSPLYKYAITIEASETVVHDAGAGVSYLRVDRTSAGDGQRESPPFHVLEDYSNLTYYLEPTGIVKGGATPTPVQTDYVKSDMSSPVEQPRSKPMLQKIGSALMSSSLDVGTFDGLPAGGDIDAATQCKALLGAISGWLQAEHGLTLSDAVFCELQVRDLGCFEAVNKVYGEAMDACSPPPRVCIETPLPVEVHVRFRIFLRDVRKAGDNMQQPDVKTLRVQSISTWAMACIGPYSQAFWLDDVMYSAGVIGLIPHKMALPTNAELLELATKGDCAPVQRWEGELWMLMRSLTNVLKEIKAAKCVRVAHVYTALVWLPSDVLQEAVLQYLRQEEPDNDPLITITVVPRLPKNGVVEINIISADTPAAALKPKTLLDGSVNIAQVGERTVVVSVECSAESAPTAGKGPTADDVASWCCSAVRRAAEALRQDREQESSAWSLQVQYVPALCGNSDALHLVISRAVEQSLAEDPRLADAVAVSYMPVLQTGAPGSPLRLVVTASFDGPL
eukprot:TRINITY_DN32478_c0_g1_i1.p1 TRINITY_DN32478_c0_g1~~TRINITY_DN32478_c0_g1_i1.p1  ORF type:complete len:716 (-),score=138.93 TRINITY_DN32478_c0_g1_i1:409-2556(-)